MTRKQRGLAHRGKQLHKKKEERRCFIGRHIWSLCARVGLFGVRRSGSNLLPPPPPSSKAAVSEEEALPRDVRFSLSLSCYPPPTLFLPRTSLLAGWLCHQASIWRAQCFGQMFSPTSKKIYMSGDAGYAMAHKLASYKSGSRHGLFEEDMKGEAQIIFQ